MPLIISPFFGQRSGSNVPSSQIISLKISREIYSRMKRKKTGFIGEHHNIELVQVAHYTQILARGKISKRQKNRPLHKPKQYRIPCHTSLS